MMRGNKSPLGRNDIKNWELRSFWGEYVLKWGFTKLQSINQITRDSHDP
jgi:hypothetical protein